MYSRYPDDWNSAKCKDVKALKLGGGLLVLMLATSTSTSSNLTREEAMNHLGIHHSNYYKRRNALLGMGLIKRRRGGGYWLHPKFVLR